VVRKGILLSVAFLATSCAGYTRATKAGFDAYSNRDFTAAETVYTPGAEQDSKDQLVYVFDRGTVRYTAGNYEQSIKDFLLADKLSEIKDYTAIGTEAASIFVNDQILQYKGEEFEHVLASMYVALNFAALKKDEEAAVAARMVNRKLERLRDEAKRTYQLNAFAQYLAGLVRERQGNWNFAYVDYKKTHQLVPHFSRIRTDLIKGALWSDSSSDLHKWKKTLGVTEEEILEAKKEFKKTGGIVLLYQNGFGPEKVPHRSWHELPEYRARYNKHKAARLLIDGEEVARTEVLYDVEKVAMENLNQKYALYVAKRIAGVVGREVLGHELDKQKEGLGTLVKIAMTVASQADLRAWSTLPRDFQVARVQRPPGKYKVSLKLEDIYGTLSEEKDLGEVEIKKGGDLALLQYRSLND
jgi:uncharacterized protein